jgi:hypothetical protein
MNLRPITEELLDQLSDYKLVKVNIFLTCQYRSVVYEVNVKLEEFNRPKQFTQSPSFFFFVRCYTSKCCVFLKDLCFYAIGAHTLDRPSDFLTIKFLSVALLVCGSEKTKAHHKLLNVHLTVGTRNCVINSVHFVFIYLKT